MTFKQQQLQLQQYHPNHSKIISIRSSSRVRRRSLLGVFVLATTATCSLLSLQIQPCIAETIRKSEQDNNNNHGGGSGNGSNNQQYGPVVVTSPMSSPDDKQLLLQKKLNTADERPTLLEEKQQKNHQQHQHPPAVVPKKPPATPVRRDDMGEQDFLDWCASAGIQTKLTIAYFDYTDYMTTLMTDDDYDDDYDEDLYNNLNIDNSDEETTMGKQKPKKSVNNNHAPIRVRGLAAQHDIEEGSVVISIPYSSMIAIPTTIDQDVILRNIMGPEARIRLGWDQDFFIELSLLTVALLYHRTLGAASPLYHYIQILESSPTNNIPFLWDARKLRQDATPGVRAYARGIAKDIREAHSSVVVHVLQREYPQVFDRDTYSLQQFQWAFSLINSRHWHLPIPDFAGGRARASTTTTTTAVREESENHAPQRGIGDQVPPASLPTDEWVLEHQGDNAEDTAASANLLSSSGSESISFLAPVADLINFGPPCTRGSFNADTQAFELVATCSFRAGQEITYWYSDDCDDVVISNYGFTHPMVPSCPTVEELQEELELWKLKTETIETQLEHAYDDLTQLERELERSQELLESCQCDGFDSKGQQYQQRHATSSKSRKSSNHDHIRGSSSTNAEQQPSDHERGNGIRRKAWNHQKSAIGQQL